jgi:urea transport system ATP-binding protein
LNRLRKELGIAVLVSEQVLSFAMEVADEILVLDLGRIVRTATKNAVDIEEVRSYLTV